MVIHYYETGTSHGGHPSASGGHGWQVLKPTKKTGSNYYFYIPQAMYIGVLANVLVHRMVGILFGAAVLSKRPPSWELLDFHIHHIDHNPRNNDISNLVFVTAYHNMHI
jgi:hypothetical protein